ncbi:MAG: hypothetical protein GXY83_34410 [Rhodopirellula sp.]|nr:hypothetical protein [Rhodopirellula sp.]
MNLLCRLEHGEDVDKAEQLHLEGGISHGPVHQLVGPELGGKHTASAPAGVVEQLPADFECPRFDIRTRRRATLGDCSGLLFLFLGSAKPGDRTPPQSVARD